MNAPARRRSVRSLAAEVAFRERVQEAGGEVLEPEWLGIGTPHRVRCKDGHSCNPSPNNLQRGQGMCRVCAGRDSEVAEQRFRALVRLLGGKVIEPEWLGSNTSHRVRCPQGHRCGPRPYDLEHGRGMCRTCAGQDPSTAEAAFRAKVQALGGHVLGTYTGKDAPVACRCSLGHDCNPRPSNLRRGQGMCAQCKGMIWDVFYGVADPTLGRVKFGVTSGDGRARLATHRTASYTDVVRALSGLPDAHALECHVRATLRNAGVPPVQGREYFNASVLAVVLDVVDGWTGGDPGTAPPIAGN